MTADMEDEHKVEIRLDENGQPIILKWRREPKCTSVEAVDYLLSTLLKLKVIDFEESYDAYFDAIWRFRPGEDEYVDEGEP